MVVLIDATYSHSTSMSELFKCIGNRLRDDRPIVVMKALSLIHLLLREGNSDRMLGYLVSNVDILYQSFFKTQGSEMSVYLKSYTGLLEEKVGSYREVKVDWIKRKDEGIAMFRSMEDLDLIKNTIILQKQIESAVNCSWEVSISSGIVVQQAYRFVLAELIALYHLVNEAIVKMLGNYFTMTKPNATKSLDIYKTFVKQTKKMESIFENGKKHKSVLMMDIPKFKSPPVSLAVTLEDFLRSSDFDANRQAAIDKKNGKYVEPVQKKVEKKEQPLIDFFNTVEEEVALYNRSASPQFQPFNNIWDTNDEFAKQVAGNQQMLNEVQQQLQATNYLVSSVPAPQSNPFNNFSGNSSNPFGGQQTAGIPIPMQNTGMNNGGAMSMQNTGMSMPMGMQNTGMHMSMQNTGMSMPMQNTGMAMPMSMQNTGMPMSVQNTGFQNQGNRNFQSNNASTDFSVDSIFGNSSPFTNNNFTPNVASNPNAEVDPFMQIRSRATTKSNSPAITSPQMNNGNMSNMQFNSSMMSPQINNGFMMNSQMNGITSPQMNTGSMMTTQVTGQSNPSTASNPFAQKATINPFATNNNTMNPQSQFPNTGGMPNAFGQNQASNPSPKFGNATFATSNQMMGSQSQQFQSNKQQYSMPTAMSASFAQQNTKPVGVFSENNMAFGDTQQAYSTTNSFGQPNTAHNPFNPFTS
ncbi:ANTH domain-containing protein [Globomyces pollinis-pini]|nr:ANTH domain-containing protein [Globomyces pollinis-pini]